MVGVECRMSQTARRTSNLLKKVETGASRPSKGEARWAEPTFKLWFRGKELKEVNGEAQRAKPKFEVVFWG